MHLFFKSKKNLSEKHLLHYSRLLIFPKIFPSLDQLWEITVKRRAIPRIAFRFIKIYQVIGEEGKLDIKLGLYKHGRIEKLVFTWVTKRISISI